MRQRWSFSIAVGVAYLAVFHGWRVLPREGIIASGIVATLLLATFMAWNRKYFLNQWDALFHALVIVDILLEALLIPVHDHYGFYFCAVAFALVVGGYRAHLLQAQAH